MRIQSLSLLCVAVMASGCRGGSGSSMAVAQRTERHEEKIALLEKRIASMEAKMGQLDEMREKFPALIEAVVELVDAMDRLEGRLGGGGRPAGPDPATVYAVPVAASDPSTGPRHAKVTIVEAFEYACPFCYKVRPTMQQLVKEYGNDVRIVYKHYIVHPDVAVKPALAACAAHLQGKHDAMSEGLWEQGFAAGRNFSDENIETIAKAAGIKDMARFKTDMQEACVKKVSEDQKLLTGLGVRGTPSFFINGRFLSGAQPYEMFKTLVDEELAKANAAIKGGVKVQDYYEKLVKDAAKSAAE